MKGALLLLVIGIALLLAIYFKLDIYRSQSTFDVHFHDTYIVLDNWLVIGFVTLFLGIFFSIGGLIGSRFTNKFFWFLSLLFLGVTAYYVLVYYKAFTS